MFSGIVEFQGHVLAVRRVHNLLQIDVEKPEEFDDLKVGDSICTSGVCLTVESFDDKRMTFALGAETLQVTGWTEASLLSGAPLNLERSLRMGDRIHGHLVSGHVDGTGEVVAVTDLGGSVLFEVRAPKELLRYVWKKGGWAVNGVSLTVNDVRGEGESGVVSHCLIPETLRRTNLARLKAGDRVNLEIDTVARGLVALLETHLETSPRLGSGERP